MDSSTRKWMLGCGIGCGALVLIVVLITAGGYMVVRDVAREVRDVQESQEALEARFGAIAEYEAPADGRLDAERLETFLAAREGSSEERRELEGRLAILEASDERQGPRRVLQKVQAGIRLVPRVIAYLDARNEALLTAEMGLGEYLYIYAAGFYGLLGHDPGEGPPFTITSTDDDGHGATWSLDPEGDESTRRKRQAEIGRQVNRMLLPVLRDQLAAAESGPVERRDPAWAEALRREVELLELRPHRWPWQDGLPEPLHSSLEPFRSTLEESWSRLVNPVEVVVNES
ncbi:MAG: hypothetical protein R6X25_10800 [Candidatus Krumholzibacteriia bacterium]